MAVLFLIFELSINRGRNSLIAEKISHKFLVSPGVHRLIRCSFFIEHWCTFLIFLLFLSCTHSMWQITKFDVSWIKGRFLLPSFADHQDLWLWYIFDLSFVGITKAIAKVWQCSECSTIRFLYDRQDRRRSSIIAGLQSSCTSKLGDHVAHICTCWCSNLQHRRYSKL